MGRRHASGHLSPLRNENIAYAMDQKLFQIPEIGLDLPVEFHREICGNGSLHGPMDLGWAHPELNRQAVVGPGLIT